ncbi:Mitotic checkpoint serine/threonine-protein kinase BUB1 [Eufriesea mexicana]|nr:Mitotic checkpoint serine/threonine-protein kinase BUB1 [Eufriesea mexicana]
MDPATVIALCKENIQPLRYGRNAVQLGTALRAQEDTDAQQILLQEKHWYEYILWVEQSYPKNGHESHVGKLLQQCLAIFEKEIKYHQDRRYIRLWINYISMQKNPLELYQLLHNNGIGTMVADMYRAWAFELEQIEDYKRADEVYLMGLSALAEPQDELDYAHKNFQLAVARKTLGRTDDRNETSLFEQRQAFSSLRAIKSGKRVGSVRTGHRVREHFPGTVPQISSTIHHNRPNSRIQIYQDDLLGEMKGSSILDYVPVEDTIHKENTIKPGPWNSGNKRCPLITSAIKSSFKVHEDQPDDFDTNNLRLFPNHTYFFDGSKYPEYLTVPVFVPDPPNPNIILRPHYPKELVYANNMDQSMEEVRAQLYLQRAQTLEKRRDVVSDIIETSHQVQHKNFESEHQRHDISLQELQRQRREFEQQELTERQRKMEQQRREAEQLELDRQRLQAEQQELQRQQYEAENQALETQRREAEQRELERLEAERIEAERIEAERLEAQRMEAELNSQRKLQSSFMHQHHTSSLNTDPEEHLLGQSLTVNTKEAMSVVQDMWRSPEPVPSTPNFRTPMTPRIPDSKTKSSFDIHMDSSMTQQAMSSSKHHSGYNVQPYNDQENHQNYTAHQSYSNQEHQTSYGNPGLHNTYQYQMQQHHEQQVQQPHSRPHHSHHQQLIQAHQQPHVISHHHTLPHVPHLQSHSQIQHHQSHPQQHQPPHNQHLHHQPHQAHQHIQHIQQVYGNMMPNDVAYQQYPSQLESTLLQQNIEPQKQLHYPPYNEPDIETSKPYRMPPELPYIKSPGMNRRDIKYLESAEDKENAIVVDYNGPVEENMTPKPAENNLYIDESLGITPLTGNNDTCFTEAFSTQLTSSTPMTNHFRQSYKVVEGSSQYPNQCAASQPSTETPNGETEEKLSVILESTREYISSSSGSSTHTRNTVLGFTLTKEDLVPIKEQSTSIGEEDETKDITVSANQPYEQKLQAQIQAVHAQSPRTVQRNVDQITSEIKKNCDLRKSINFKFNEIEQQEKVDSMECEEHHEPMEETEEESFQLPSGNINPFDRNLIAGLLKKIKFPQPHHAEGYVRLNINLNKLVPSTMITLGTEAYDLGKCLGKGTYGTVFKAVNLQTGQTVALKTQKPAWLRGFMDVSMAYVANNSSVLVSEYSRFGTLLAVTNQIKIATGKPLLEHLAIFFTIEILQIVEYLHKCQIIHGDIKPDNFLLMRLPTEDVRPTIQLIDFGCSIDMSLLPEKTTFTTIIKTEDFTCIEMQTGKPWTYQTDLYCLAATSHCLLFGNYMRVSNIGGRCFITSKIPRYAKKAAWEQFFTELLNVESCDKMPDLSKLRNMMEETLAQMTDAQQKFRNFVNILNKR